MPSLRWQRRSSVQYDMHSSAPVRRSAFVGLMLWMACPTHADVYMHNMRGSNNKINEASNTVRNPNRLFNSQNNAAGGYQVGDKCDPVCSNANNQYNASKEGAGEGVMYFYEGSTLPLEWTTQHSCGPESMGPNAHCDLILQLLCDDTAEQQLADPLSAVILRDGSVHNTIPFNADPEQGREDAVDLQYGRHEPYTYYRHCTLRERNKGLFNADQNVNNNQGATATRQQPNNNRYGYECPEERDYYPYWHPTPWRDVAVLTSDVSRCAYYQAESENVKPRHACSLPQFNQQESCEAEGGVWAASAAKGLPPPVCQQVAWGRDNHLGNGLDGHAHSFNWTLPSPPHNATQATCVLRLRYNISTGEYNGWGEGVDMVDSRYNEDRSPVKNNPERDFVKGGDGRTGPLRLALNTAQTGRTFQDRSHKFRIVKRPDELPNGVMIHNLNVRGRRGNIVQVYPSVEYDFVPTTLVVRKGDRVHLQWTGSDANNNGNDGEGRRMTDRSNLVEVLTENRNVPKQIEQYSFFVKADGTPDVELVERLTYLGQNQSTVAECDPDTNDQQSITNCKVLNLAPAYFDAGLVEVNANEGVHHMLSTRNNNFSNRSQKVTVVVLAALLAATGGGGLSRATIVAVSATAGTAGGVGLLCLLAYATGVGQSAMVWLGLRRRKGKVADHGEQDDTEKMEEGDANTAGQAKSTTSNKVGKVWLAWKALSPQTRCVTVFATLNLAFAVLGFSMHADKPYFPGFALAKAAGYMLDLNMTLVLFPVMRNFMSFLRMTPLVEVVPMDDHIVFHKLVGGTAAFATAMHVAMHYVVMVQKADEDGGPTVTSNALGTRSGVTGHIVLGLMALMFLTAWDRVKRMGMMLGNWYFGGYNTFHYTHRLYMPVYALLLLHSEAFYKWAFWPLCMLAVDKAIGHMRAGRKVRLVHAVMEKADVIHLTMDVARFRYKPGQYLYLSCPSLGTTEWHPFTITSAPEQMHVTVHIRTRGDWTRRLMEHVCPSLERQASANGSKRNFTTILSRRNSMSGDDHLHPNSSHKGIGLLKEDSANHTEPVDAVSQWDYVHLRVDGPYGAGSEHVFDYEVAVLVGAGIGVTPFASIVKSARLQMQQASAAQQAKMRPQRIYFYWVCRDMQEFNWFSPLLQECGDDMKGLEINTYMTGELNLDDMRSKTHDEKAWAGRKWAGRPNWRRIFKAISQEHPTTNVGVFLCGPGAKELDQHCKAASTKDGTTFDFHKENF